MFFPLIDESKGYDKYGRELEEINSITEYVDQVVLHHQDKTPEDEDNDNTRNVHIVKLPVYIIVASVTKQVNPGYFLSWVPKQEYPVFQINRLPSIAQEITVPPPRLA